MSEKRELAFKDEQAVIDEVARLSSGCQATGNWSLAQACWHLNTAIAGCLKPPADTTPSPANAKYQAVLDGILAAGVMPNGISAPEGTAPPERLDESAVEAFVAGLRRLRSYEASHVDFSVFGPVPVEKFRQFILIHSALHLGMLRPTA